MYVYVSEGTVGLTSSFIHVYNNLQVAICDSVTDSLLSEVLRNFYNNSTNRLQCFGPVWTFIRLYRLTVQQ